MRILVAIESDNRSKTLGKKTLSWAARAGFDLRIFIPADETNKQLLEYCKMIEDVNYNEYLDLSIGQIVIDKEPLEYAAKFNFDAVLLIPDDLTTWKQRKDRDRMVLDYATDIGIARKRMQDEPELQQIDFDNGARLRRI